jgi:hypothetical protein
VGRCSSAGILEFFMVIALFPVSVNVHARGSSRERFQVQMTQSCRKCLQMHERVPRRRPKDIVRWYAECMPPGHPPDPALRQR